MQVPSVSIIIPCLNEEGAIDFCLDEIRRVITVNKLRAEVIAVDNGSDDTTLTKLKTYQHHFSQLVIVEEKNRGYGRAYLAGLAVAKGTVIFMADADGTYDFSELPLFLQEIDRGADLVVGNRFAKCLSNEVMPWSHRLFGNPFLSFLTRFFFNIKIHDIYGGARAIKHSALKMITIYSGGMEFAPEMIIKAARRRLVITEIPVNYRPRIGRSKLRSLADGWRTLRFILLYSPLFLFFLPGLALFLLGLCSMAVLYLTAPVIFGIQFVVHPMFLSAVLVILGYQLIFFGFFSKIYAITHFGDEQPFVETLFRFVSIERAGIVGIILTLVGVSIYGGIFVGWVRSGFGSLDQIKNSILALTLLVLGVQTFFSAFMLSTVSIKEK